MGHLSLWSFFIKMLRDQRGEVGDSKDDDPPEVDTKDDDPDKDDPDDIVITPDKDDDPDKDKLDPDKVKELQDQKTGYEKTVKELEEERDRLREEKKNLNTALHQARQTKKEVKPDAKSQLSEAQLKQILEDNPNDTDTQFNVLKYLAEQVAKGVSADSINAAEVGKTKERLNSFLKERYPDLDTPGTEIRKEIDEAKDQLGLHDHPYGDYFAVASCVLDELPQMLEAEHKRGLKDKAKADTEEKREEAIEHGKVLSSKKAGKSAAVLTKGQSETFDQMDLTPSQRKIAKQLVAKKAPKTVSVEE